MENIPKIDYYSMTTAPSTREALNIEAKHMNATSGKQPKRKYLVRLTESTDYTVAVWARDAIDAVRVAEEDFDYLVANGEGDGYSKGVEGLDDLSESPYSSKDEAYDIDSGEWLSESPRQQ